jgi:hypothetical protein
MAKDLLHEAVRKALEKDGWTIKDDPFYLYDKTLGIDYEVDLGAEKVVIAQKELQKIVVEVKSFARLSLRNEFHGILGQYMTYALALADLGWEQQLYLAIPLTAYMRLQAEPFLLRLMERNEVKFFVYNDKKQKILSWKN